MSVFGKYKAPVSFDNAAGGLDVVDPNWLCGLIFVSTDNEIIMTGLISGVATHLQKVCSSGFVPVWHACHQLELVMQEFNNSMPDEFHSRLMSVLGYLLCQQILKSSMRSKYSLVATTRWLDINMVKSSFEKPCGYVLYLNKTKLAFIPSSTRWPVLFIVSGNAARAAILCGFLQRQTLVF